MVKCYEHGVEYEEVETDFETGGIMVRGVKALKCPVGGEEMFTLEQLSEIKRRFSEVVKPLKLRRKISAAGRRPALYLPEDIIRKAAIKVGDEVEVYTEGRRIIIEPIEEPETS